MPSRDSSDDSAKSENNDPPEGSDAASVRLRRAPTAEQITTFESAIRFLNTRTNVETVRPSHIDREAVFRLDRMRALVAALGNPQDSFRSVHVAGSKGKGSICEMTAASLAGCRFTVGVFTSPHLVDIRERIRIGVQPISAETFARLINRVSTAAAGLAKKFGEVTSFEILTAAAFVYFAEEAVDVAVIEVGLGGEHDATNVITPVVSAISAIQLEHTQLLGSTLEEIARAKAGIIKPGVPVVTFRQSDEILQVLRARAAEVSAPFKVIGAELEFSSRFESSTELGPHTRVCLSGEVGNFEHLPVPLPGEHQAFNCGLALAILDVLRKAGLHVTDAQVAAGLKTTPRNGRLELIHDQPRIYIDGAHNPESIQALVKSVGAHVRSDSMVVVFGCASDKDYVGMLTKLASGADKIFFTRAEGSDRAMDPRDLQRKFGELSGRMSQVLPTLKDAINAAVRAVAKGDIVLVTGSFLLAGEAKRLLDNKARRDAQLDVASRAEVKPRTGSSKNQTDRRTSP